jgi:hypothetical protein
MLSKIYNKFTLKVVLIGWNFTSPTVLHAEGSEKDPLKNSLLIGENKSIAVS